MIWKSACSSSMPLVAKPNSKRVAKVARVRAFYEGIGPYFVDEETADL